MDFRSTSLYIELAVRRHVLIGSTVSIQSHQSEIYCYPRRTAMLGSLSWISPHHLLVQCKAYEVVVFEDIFHVLHKWQLS
ncbi:hypothetical protein Bca52824_078013 [Brassica carinata]|uniref:Uncharacterized protein n=1 Tax=Brassica carinata TaxID=52824 RepID=A0A8X7TYR6_BRACI|nr:hypothetical protein Bca52824_078013 [Brassica carinata]